jgi:hypothetical protein
MLSCSPYNALARCSHRLLLAIVLFATTDAYAQEATAFEHLDYSGEAVSASGDVPFVGWDWNDRITSVSLPSGVFMTVYEHADYGGASLTLTSSVADLRNFQGPGPDGTWNDAISSARIAYTTSTQVLLVNGSFDAYPEWMEPSAAQYQTIAATYGVQPGQWHWLDNGFAQVTWPYYSGIFNGAAQLSGVINAMPAGSVNVITHSHGGNVALLATQFYTNRPLARLINLATPVNFDIRYYGAPWVNHMCTASSWHDWVQFVGASPTQVNNFLQQSYWGYQYGSLSAEAFINGNYADAAYYSALAYNYIAAGYSWFESTKLELHGWTIAYGSGGHSDMHEPDVWNALPAACKQ